MSLQPFWVDFMDRASACIEAADESAALEAAKAHGTPKLAKRLPYPREPRVGVASTCPSFCYARNVAECLGKTACPQRRSCTE